MSDLAEVDSDDLTVNPDVEGNFDRDRVIAAARMKYSLWSSQVPREKANLDERENGPSAVIRKIVPDIS